MNNIGVHDSDANHGIIASLLSGADYFLGAANLWRKPGNPCSVIPPDGHRLYVVNCIVSQ